MKQATGQAGSWPDEPGTVRLSGVPTPASRGGRVWWHVGRALCGLLALAVLAATAVGWVRYNDIVAGTVTADVLDRQAGGPKPLDGATDILLVGMDSRVDAQGNPLPKELLARLNAGVADGETNTDTLILLRVPNDGTKATGISIPRDAYVDIPGGYGKHKINSAYGRAKRAAMDRLRAQGVTNEADLEVRSNQEGAQTLVRTIQQLTGSTIDHFAQVNLLGFADITEAVGGVEVCLLNPVNDKFSGARFPQGLQTVSGPSALAFVRQRHDLPRGDLDRIVRQQVFLKGMAAKALSTGILTDQAKLNSLLGSLKKSIVLDQSWTLVDFARQTQGLAAGVEFQTVPTGTLVLRTPADGLAVEVNPVEVQKFVKALLNDGTTPAEPPAPDNSTVTVDVRNANGTRGIAGKVATTLTDQGFTLGQTTTVTVRATSVVRYAEGEQDNADRVVAALGRDIAVEQDASLTAGHVAVLVGKDYKDEVPDRLTGTPLLQPQPPTPTETTGTTGTTGTPCVN